MRDNLRHFNIDPEEKYPSSGPRNVEKNAERVLALLPKSNVERTRDCIQLNCDGEEGIVVLVTPEVIELRLPTVEWTMGSYGPAASSRLWKRVQISEITDRELETLLKEALKERQRVQKLPLLRKTLSSRAYA
jgi:hypothetical protein